MKVPMDEPELLPTDVDALFNELDGGQFTAELAMALSTVARASIENDAPGELTIKIKAKPAGAVQLQLEHTLSYKYNQGKRVRQISVPGSTVMVVSESGRMSLFAESQLSLDITATET